MSTLVSGVRGLTNRLLHLHAGESKCEVNICRGLAGGDVESSLAHEANRWAIERHLLWWGRADMGRGPMLTGWAGQSRGRSRGGRGPGRLADEAREAMAALREVHHALRQREPLRPPPDNEPLIHGLCSPCVLLEWRLEGSTTFGRATQLRWRTDTQRLTYMEMDYARTAREHL